MDYFADHFFINMGNIIIIPKLDLNCTLSKDS
jgi:hypothetical protein